MILELILTLRYSFKNISFGAEIPISMLQIPQIVLILLTVVDLGRPAGLQHAILVTELYVETLPFFPHASLLAVDFSITVRDSKGNKSTSK